AWVLSVVFVRTLEDRGLIDPRIAGPDERRLVSARDREATFVQVTPFLGPREYLLAVFRELAHLPGAREVFDARHNPIWVLAPSSEGARALLDFFQQVDGATGAPVFTFLGTETRFLGDLYQDLSETVRKRYALLQTPDFVEKFILEQTLAPAIEEFGLAEVKLIDPTCGSGHFLLGAFRDLLAAWQQQEPTTPIEELARRALDQVYGVDINPYAVAIARFRLVLAVLDAVGITRLDKAPALRPHVVVADSLLHRLKEQQLRLSGQLSMDEWASWGDALFRLAEPGAVAEVLGRRYHAVVGNPPYITEKDATKRKQYRDTYESAAGLFTLAAPFTERFFDLAVDAGFVGLINSNAWTKRDFGRTLIEKVLPRFEIQKVVDTAGCYLPGHGTPTLLLFGRNRSGAGSAAITVLGKRGEQRVPSDPATAPVWVELTEHNDEVGYEGQYVSVESASRADLKQHPWILTGGGASAFLRVLTESASSTLGSGCDSVGFMCITKQDDALTRPVGVLTRRRVEADVIRPFVTGQDLRDWRADPVMDAIFPYDKAISTIDINTRPGLRRELLPLRSTLEDRKVFGGKNYREAGKHWWEYGQIPIERAKRPFTVAFAYVATHNNFVFVRRGMVLNQHAPIITLQARFSESDHQALLGYLNSSTVGFWCRLVMFPKGGDQVGEGARLS
ncbi:MAG: BREX-2 system adenine-specific DNA-methyltransferase PglX, partial [Planctomycetes bacterium]|nr:BREX-2 system adenine-specific DNA-methyltransferase PglX [Planctomycetota bacterium]